jgi:hypothetical protein
VGFKVVVTPEIMALAGVTSEERPRNIKHHKPAAHPLGEIAGALAEHAWAYKFGIPQTEVKSDGGPYGHGDGGFDFVMGGVKIDVKASPVHPRSWVVGAGPIRTDWYVFAFVTLPDTVEFVAKAPGWWVEPQGLVYSVGNKRLIRYAELNEEWRDIRPDDFGTKAGLKKVQKISQQTFSRRGTPGG